MKAIGLINFYNDGSEGVKVFNFLGNDENRDF